ncbi:hypothetical protein SAMN04489712_10142 [Thermomonospora echinospora]|uniref:Terpene synthase n=1 Tax=Thermomonospora echinospora TaxID=1992 RepID=A0A1H5S1U0_9ACTN|nr:hypothetical protein [Thermomonospora echinospora]SEF44450.1 hypothetical protein SAMN04489712_10142 [Thermomonospora echinospora]
MDAALVLSLADRVAAFATRSGMHPAAQSIGARTDDWARARALVIGDSDASPLGRARLERLACRVFPHAPADRVALFARWLVWTFALDDRLDDTPMGGSATAVDGLYGDLLGALRRGHARPQANPLELALAELWHDTVPGTSPQWRRRFLRHMEQHRAGCADEAVNRRTGRMPALAEYPPLRRRAAAPFLYDLIEPVLGVEVDLRLERTPAWKALVDGTADLITWANDVVSYPRETAQAARVPANLVAVVRHDLGLEAAPAAARVVDHIARRAPQVREAARSLETEFDRLAIGPQDRGDVAVVVRTLLHAPRAYLDWLTETGRYTPPGGRVPTVPAHRPAVRPRPPLDDQLTEHR